MKPEFREPFIELQRAIDELSVVRLRLLKLRQRQGMQMVEYVPKNPYGKKFKSAVSHMLDEMYNMDVLLKSNIEDARAAARECETAITFARYTWLS